MLKHFLNFFSFFLKTYKSTQNFGETYTTVTVLIFKSAQLILNIVNNCFYENDVALSVSKTCNYKLCSYSPYQYYSLESRYPSTQQGLKIKEKQGGSWSTHKKKRLVGFPFYLFSITCLPSSLLCSASLLFQKVFFLFTSSV